jgi:hypothetical protein
LLDVPVEPEEILMVSRLELMMVFERVMGWGEKSRLKSAEVGVLGTRPLRSFRSEASELADDCVVTEKCRRSGIDSGLAEDMVRDGTRDEVGVEGRSGAIE